jgi:hypothetical protein
LSEVESVNPQTQRALWAHRVVQCGLLLAIVWKCGYFLRFDEIYRLIPLADDFFPDWLRSLGTLRIALVGSILSVTLNMFTSNQLVRRLCCVTTLIGMSVLCIHQGSYNDATFTTAWWTSVWAMWFVYRIPFADKITFGRAAFLSRLIISMILLGGAVGKWTPEYWSGEVFFEIYYRSRDFWFFNLLRNNFDADTLREIATWYSRMVIAVETLSGFGLWLLPPRWAAGAAVLLLSGIAIFSNFYLFSVMFSLIGLAAVGFFVPSKQPETV